jgi:hypothetical protein
MQRSLNSRFLPVADKRRGNPLAPRSTFESGCINEDLPDFSFNAAAQERISHSVATAGRQAPLFLKNPFKFNDGLHEHAPSAAVAVFGPEGTVAVSRCEHW